MVKIIQGENDFASMHPELLSEWDYERNTVLPTQLSSNSSKNVWWKLPYDDPKTGKHLDNGSRLNVVLGEDEVDIIKDER